MFFILINPNAVYAQFEAHINYRIDILKGYSIKSISEWIIYNEPTKSNIDSVLSNYHQYDENGNMIHFINRNYRNIVYKDIRYEYDSLNNPVFEYRIDEDSTLREAKEFIYENSVLIEQRSYGYELRNYGINERYKIRNEKYTADIYNYNNEENVYYKSYCFINYPPITDSIVKSFDTLKNRHRTYSIPKKIISKDTIRCIRTIEYLHDNNGNIISIKTLPESKIHIHDSFSYDSFNNLIFKISFNSGDLHKGNIRRFKEGEHRYVNIENFYNENGQLVERNSFFNGNSLCYIKTYYTYYLNGILAQKSSFVYYLKGKYYLIKSEGDEIDRLMSYTYNHDTLALNIWLRDTALIYRYNEFGEVIDIRKYFGIGQIERRGNLFYQKYTRTNKLGIPEYGYTYYGKRNDYPFSNEIEPAVKFEKFFNHYHNGLVKEIKNNQNLFFYRIQYEYY